MLSCNKGAQTDRALDSLVVVGMHIPVSRVLVIGPLSSWLHWVVAGCWSVVWADDFGCGVRHASAYGFGLLGIGILPDLLLLSSDFNALVAAGIAMQDNDPLFRWRRGCQDSGSVTILRLS